MKKTVLVFCMALGSLKGISQNKNYIDLPFIETSAHVDTLITPDLIYLDILIAEKDTKGRLSVEEQEAGMEKTLKGIGVNTRQDLTLSDVTSNFRKYFLKQQDVLKSKSYSLVIRDAQTAGKVIVALEEVGISNVYLDRTEYSKIEQLRLEMKAKAIRKAKLQAAYMTAPLNQKVGAAIYISDLPEVAESLQGRVAGVRIRGAASIDKAEFKPADIEFEKIKVESSVNVKFKLEG